MIVTPDRLSTAAAQIERGEQPDWQQLAELQALDLVRAGRAFMEAAILSQEAEDERIKQWLGD